jgi:glutamate 5-kinase
VKAADRTAWLARVRRVVIKLGSAVLAAKDGGIDAHLTAEIARQAAALRERKIDVILVSSGAIASGLAVMDLKRKPSNVTDKQVLAAIGQMYLMRDWAEAFARHDCRVAQILLSRGDLDDRQRYLNARSAISRLLEMGVVPIVNENDTTAVEELTFGDNDILSAAVAAKVEAQLLVLLTIVDGLHDAQRRVIPFVEHVDEEVLRLVRSERSALGRGGMEAKLQAAKNAATSGVAAVIADGKAPRVIERLFAGEALGTWFVPSPHRLTGRKRWIAFGKAHRDHFVAVDAGAARALREQSRSLLPIGVTQVQGRFERGDVVEIRGPDGQVLGRGLTNYASAQIEAIRGAKSAEIAARLGLDQAPHPEVIHRDNLIIHH